MIFVTIGMNDAPWNGLFFRMDDYAARTGEEVIMQVGNTGFEGKHTECFKFGTNDSMKEIYDRADMIVCHAGLGTILNALERNIPVVMIPRVVVVPELTRDQQGAVAEKVEKIGRGVVVNDLDDVFDGIEKARALKFPPYKRDDSLVKFLIELLAEIDAGHMKTDKRR